MTPRMARPAIDGAGWFTSGELWEKLTPLTRQMRREPTPAEDVLWKRLRGRQILGHRFRRQHCIERFIVDFYCSEAALIVEVDGPIHQYHREEDDIRRVFIESLGFRFLRFSNEQVLGDMDDVLSTISSGLTSPPDPLSVYREGASATSVRRLRRRG